ncbi:zinc-dependent alcohol dehydrogenase family protein [Stutzerimonas urumqiensis]|uniref:zinc-dependent alcohol dehydrogenase family protein n=1 Tax=Stutzerimonas urumqiensis TaxID=638269 RepID=UPI003BAC8A6E
MSRIIRFHQFGPADVLRLEQREAPVPGPGEVQIAVQAIGVSWNDVLWRQDLAPRHPRLPAGLGSEVAGEVLAVGDGVSGFAPGDRVASFPAHDPNAYPLYADCVVLPQTSLVRYPDVLDAAGACVHYTPMLLAYFAFAELARLEPGQRVLVTGANLCAGPSIVQMARALGGQVIATCASESERDFLRELGAERVIVTEEEDLVTRVQKLTEGRGVDVVLDGCGGSQMKLLGEVIAPRGKLILYGLSGGNETALPACAAFEKNFKFFIHCLCDFTGQPDMGIEQDRRAVEAALMRINQLTADRLLVPRVERVFPLEQAAEAHRQVESGHPRGRIVLSTS